MGGEAMVYVVVLFVGKLVLILANLCVNAINLCSKKR